MSTNIFDTPKTKAANPEERCGQGKSTVNVTGKEYKMWLQELHFTGRELLFGVTIHFIPLRKKRIKEKVNGKEKRN